MKSKFLFVFSVKMTLAFLIGLSFSQVSYSDVQTGSCSDSQKSKNTTRHTTQIRGKNFNYLATTGFMEVISRDMTSKACIFYTSYVGIGGEDHAKRPITFAFNGGPGSASIWLHLGLMGPKRVDLGPEGLTVPSTLGLITNDFSPLDVTDIVMIDPVATGFSFTENPLSTTTGSSSSSNAPGVPFGNSVSDKFFGVTNDYNSIATFVQNFLIANGRWTSPKYILGESYGGIRGSLLAWYLQDALGIEVNGLILISPALSSITFFGSSDNPVPYWTFFPSFATTAWFHKKLAASFQKMDVATVYQQAQVFASGEYRNALEQGSDLDPREMDTVAQKMSDYTGLSKDQILQLNLKMSLYDFANSVLVSEGLSIGGYDSRYTSAAGRGGDPSSVQPGFAFTAAINDYLRLDLGFSTPSPYVVMGDTGMWYAGAGGEMPNVMETLARALSDNPRLKVMVASGYFDLTCPMETVSYEISQTPGGKKMSSRITQKKYLGGHMMYINPAALAPLKTDIAEFINKTL